MSPLDILIFLFFILVTIQAATSCIDYWKNTEDNAATVRTPHISRQTATLSRTVRTGRPSSVRVTPIKRVDTRITASSPEYIFARPTQLKDKGAA
ncbi:MAG: hypothetical protein IKG03_04385 [Clostridiales bacterium]|nr:hypothetical protein [Clostridiales bacterium]